MKRRYWWGGCVLAAIVLASVVSSFTYYTSAIPAPAQALPPPNSSDAIVVLTGSKGRISTAAELLRHGTARYLYISGVHQDVTASAIARRHAIDARTATCCVFVDGKASSTLDNALITARWLQDNRLRRVHLVTATWHMPRSLQEFAAQAPDVTVLPYPVGEPFAWNQLLLDASLRRYYFREYSRYMALQLRRAAGVSVR